MDDNFIPKGRPGPSVQEVYARDDNPPPAVLRGEFPATGQSLDDVSTLRYFDQGWFDQEVEKVWRKCWQFACRVEDIPNVGDHTIYEIVHDSLIVVRTGPDEIRAYVNACLHRGTLLRTKGGSVKQFRCPFHGFTWDLDGKLVEIPSAWDFPQVDPPKWCLPEAKVGVWGGFVFVNFDPDCEPLESYLEILPEHFKMANLEDRYIAAHVAKTLDCNWKLAMEAFIEAFHVAYAHPQVLGYYGDLNTQYDVFPGVRHVDRMISLHGVPSPSMGDLEPDTTIRHIRRDWPFFGGPPIEEELGDTPRAKLANRARKKITRSSGRDMSGLSDAEALDLIEYSLFPNMVPWAGQGMPILYRFRPKGNNPEQCVMELMFMFAKAPDGSHPPPAEINWLSPGQLWADAPELGNAAVVADQDTDNLQRIQKGIRTSRKPGATFAQYQESRLRHFHETLDYYMAR